MENDEVCPLSGCAEYFNEQQQLNRKKGGKTTKNVHF
jgi:hypothetical protein